MKYSLLSLATLFLVGCSTPETNLRKDLEKNPDIVFDLIRKHPEAFIEAVNFAAEKARDSQAQRAEQERIEKIKEQIVNPIQPKLDPERRLLGKSGAPITIVKYSDFQCPACRMAHYELEKFIKNHEGEIQLYYKNFPLDFHPQAAEAAALFEALVESDKTKANEFREHLFANQQAMGKGGFFEQALKAVGEDPKAIKAKSESKTVQAKLEADRQEIRELEFSGTPVTVINGVVLDGAQKAETLEQVLSMIRTHRE